MLLDANRDNNQTRIKHKAVAIGPQIEGKSDQKWTEGYTLVSDKDKYWTTRNEPKLWRKIRQENWAHAIISFGSRKGKNGNRNRPKFILFKTKQEKNLTRTEPKDTVFGHWQRQNQTKAVTFLDAITYGPKQELVVP